MSCELLLKSYIEEKGAATRNELRDYGSLCNFDIATTDRKIRDLTNKGFIVPIKGTKGFNAKFRYISPNTLRSQDLSLKSSFSPLKEQTEPLYITKQRADALKLKLNRQKTLL